MTSSIKYIHGSKLENKVASTNDSELGKALKYYQKWKTETLKIEGRNKKDIEQLVNLLNEYKSKSEPIFDSRPNSAQEVLQPSIIEEFFEFLFVNLENVIKTSFPVLTSGKGYLDLVFNPKDSNALIKNPEFTIRTKDHDFIIGAKFELVIRNSNGEEQSQEIIVPGVAIECKRYLERNMLDECSGTAEKVKRATPYCLYIVVAEYLKMDDARPEISRIDEIYILRKQKNSDRLSEGFLPNAIDSALVIDLYEMVVKHLKKIWWDPESGLKSGKVFNF